MRFEFKTDKLGLMTMRVVPEDSADVVTMTYWSQSYAIPEYGVVIPLYATMQFPNSGVQK